MSELLNKHKAAKAVKDELKAKMLAKKIFNLIAKYEQDLATGEEIKYVSIPLNCHKAITEHFTALGFTVTVTEDLGSYLSIYCKELYGEGREFDE